MVHWCTVDDCNHVIDTCDRVIDMRVLIGPQTPSQVPKEPHLIRFLTKSEKVDTGIKLFPANVWENCFFSLK